MLLRLCLHSFAAGLAIASAVDHVTLLGRAPSVAAAPGRTCTAALRQPTPSGATCGQAGSLRNPKIQLIGQASTLEECRNSCIFNNKQCVSFSYNGQSKRCITYTATIKGSGFVPNPQSNTMFWHRVCYQKTCTTPEQPPPNTAGTGARAPCGNGICGQAYLATGDYTDQYLVECGNTYDVSMAYQTVDAQDFFDCANQCDDLSTCFRMSFDHTLSSQNCYFFDKTPEIDSSLAPNPNFDAVEVAGTYYPDAPGAVYRGADDSYDVATCPSPQPTTPALDQCDAKLQGNHGPNTCTYTVRCATKYKGTALTAMPTSTFFGCLDVCDKNLKCDSITWEHKTGICTIWLESTFEYRPFPFQGSKFFPGYSSAFFNYDCPYIGNGST